MKINLRSAAFHDGFSGVNTAKILEGRAAVGVVKLVNTRPDRFIDLLGLETIGSNPIPNTNKHFRAALEQPVS